MILPAHEQYSIVCCNYWAPHSVRRTYIHQLTMLAQTIGPISVEVAGLAELPSMLSLSWLSVVLPTLCKCNWADGLVLSSFSEADISSVSEVIALKLRRPQSSRPYLYPQIFAGTAYLVASVSLYGVRRLYKSRISGDGTNG